MKLLMMKWSKSLNFHEFLSEFLRFFSTKEFIVDDRSIGLPMLRPMVPSVFSKPSADGFYFKNHRFSEKMAEKDHLGNILRK